MITVRMELDVAPAIKQLTDLERRQLPFATAVALNRTVEDALAQARKEIGQRFIVRMPGFILPPLQLPRVMKATARKPEAIFALADDEGEGSIGRRRSQILSKFELGGIKSAGDLDFPIAIPTRHIRPTPRALVPRQLYPKNLRLHPRRDASGSLLALRQGKVVTREGKKISDRRRKKLGLVGLLGTFTLPNVDTGRVKGVFQRIGPGHGDIEMIWAYRRQIPIPKLLDWIGIATRTAEERWAENFEGALAFALRTAR